MIISGNRISLGIVPSSSSTTPPTVEWLKADSIIKSWIFLTLSETLQGRLVTANPKKAKEAWDIIECIYLDNNHIHTIALKGQLWVIHLRDKTVDAYFQKIESIVTLLNALGSPLRNDDVVTYAINGLNDKFARMAGIITHSDPFPDLGTVQSIVTTEEMQINSK
ncbi:hypothetical protein Tco_0490903 [Tanacetum coccineum]